MVVLNIWIGPLRGHDGIIDLNNFTEKSRQALTEAQNIGTRLEHQGVDVEHLLLALLEQQGGLVRSLFEKARVAPDSLKAKVEEELGRIPADRSQ
jgi:ATP-dependent Clp protease ATP-binding subunit ClpB